MPANITPVQPVLGFFLVLRRAGRFYLSLTILNMCGIMVLSWEVLRPANKIERGAYCENFFKKGKRYFKKDKESIRTNKNQKTRRQFPIREILER